MCVGAQALEDYRRCMDTVLDRHFNLRESLSGCQ